MRRPSRLIASHLILSLLAALLAAALPATSGAIAAPRVVVTLKPLHALVSGVMAGIAEPHLLIPGASSPHTFALKPSDTRALSNADLIVWIGPALETMLSRPLDTLAGRATIVTIATAPGIRLLPARTSASFATDDHGHGHGQGGIATHDMHLWLDPVNAKTIVAAVAGHLATVDPPNASRYGANSARIAADLERLATEVEAVLAPVRARPFLVMHDAYQYLEARFGLTAAGAIAIDPSRQPGSRHVRRLRDRIKNAGIACIFSEPQFAPRLARTLTEGSDVRHGVLDPIGAAIDAGPELYTTLMRTNADAIARCLAPDR